MKNSDILTLVGLNAAFARLTPADGAVYATEVILRDPEIAISAQDRTDLIHDLKTASAVISKVVTFLQYAMLPLSLEARGDLQSLDDHVEAMKKVKV